MTALFDQIAAARDAIASRWTHSPRVGIVLGTGLGAKPICNTDVFCFAPPDTPPENLPAGVLHPKKVMKGVVAGVRDYGNRIGIPTVNGAICFDPRYLGNPLVFCGTVGLIPVTRSHKEPKPGEPTTQEGMYLGLQSAYRTIASEINASLIPVGEAFHQADNDLKWQYKKDESFNPKAAKSASSTDVAEHSRDDRAARAPSRSVSAH